MKIFRYLNPEAAPPPDDAKNTTPEDKARKKGERMKTRLNQREKKILKAAAYNLSGIGDRRKARTAIDTLFSPILRAQHPNNETEPQPQPRKKAPPRRRITQKEAAAIWDVTIRTIRNWENGKTEAPQEYIGRDIDVFTMRRLAELYRKSKGVKKGAIKRYSYDENRASDNRRE